jgi:hypothetical protein
LRSLASEQEIFNKGQLSNVLNEFVGRAENASSSSNFEVKLSLIFRSLNYRNYVLVKLGECLRRVLRGTFGSRLETVAGG